MIAHKLIIIFHHPLPAHFEQQWSEVFVPLAEKLPGLRRVTVSHTQGGPAGPVEVYLLHELHFDSLAAVKAAMASPAGLAAGQALVKLAGKQATLLFAEHMEDTPPAGQP
jgi:uncharacterized protein (TIGR02118 family)